MPERDRSSEREEPASVGQRVLWMMEHYSGAGGTLNSNLLYRVRGPLDLVRLRHALELVAMRHESLRTTFRVGRQLTRVIHDTASIQFHEIDLSRSSDGAADLDEAIKDQLSRPFDLTEEPLRCFAYRLGSDEYALAIVTHHLATDAWSAGVISSELSAAYRHVAGELTEMPAVGWQYTDFVEWQRSRLQGDRLRALQKAWLDQLRGLELPRLPPPREPLPRTESAIEWEWIDPQSVRTLRQRALEEGATLFALLLSVFYALLYRETGQRDLAVASLIANRGQRNARSTVGFLANMVVLRTAFLDARTLSDLVREATKTSLHALLHQELPCQLLPPGIFAAGLPRRPYDVVFQMEAGDSLSLAIDGLDVTPMPPPDGIRHRFDLEFMLCPMRDDGMQIMVRYSADRFDPSWVRELAVGYRKMLTEICSRTNIALAG